MSELLTSNERVCRGCEHKIPWDWVFCAWCGEENDRQQPCERCHGSGEIVFNEHGGDPAYDDSKPCAECGGSGRAAAETNDDAAKHAASNKARGCDCGSDCDLHSVACSMFNPPPHNTPCAETVATHARWGQALAKLTNGYKYPTEVCAIAREALGVAENTVASETSVTASPIAQTVLDRVVAANLGMFLTGAVDHIEKGGNFASGEVELTDGTKIMLRMSRIGLPSKTNERLTPPRCVVTDCSEPSAHGHARCAKHLKSIGIEP